LLGASRRGELDLPKSDAKERPADEPAAPLITGRKGFLHEEGAAAEAGAAGRGASKSQLALVIMLGALAALPPLAIDMYLPAFPRITEDLSTRASTVQLSLTACLAGLALGQLVAGPMSDKRGRRVPLLVGMVGFVGTSALCAIAPSATVLVALRFLQGLFGAAGVAVGRAIVRDLFDGVQAVRFFSRLMLVTGIAPILAPIVGAQVELLLGWRAIFAALALAALALLLAVLLLMPETWPRHRRTSGGVRADVSRMAALAQDRVLMGYALCGGLGFAGMFAYIAGSPFVIQNAYGASPQVFSLAFGVNALGLTVISQVNGQLAGRFSPRALLKAGMLVNCLVVSERTGLVWLLVPLFIMVASLGVVMPNSMALAMTRHPEAAGSASALLGVLQFVIGAAAAPLVGLAGPDSALPMGIVIAALGVAGLTALLTLTGGREPSPHAP
jgi:DHA1 family bicyclomycin/chloramphenicol resistance-like MFS transporter